MEDFGLVSIITPTYNSSEFISRTILSVINQTYTNWEMLITDDCSSDSTCQEIKRFIDTDSRIKLFRLETNSGAGIARNNSIEKAKGKYIAFLDSDDMWMPHKLEAQLKFMNKKNCAITGSSYLTIDRNDNVTGIIVAPKVHTFWQNKCDDKIGFLTCMYNTEKVGKIYMPLLRKRQDWGFTMRVLKQCKVAYQLKEPLAYYRKGHESLSKHKMSLIKYYYIAYMDVLDWSFIRAFLFFWFVFIPTYCLKRLEVRIINR